MKFAKFAGMICILGMLCSATTLCAKEYQIDTVAVTLPELQGWVDASELYPEWVETMKNLMQPNIKVCTGLLPQSDADLIHQGKNPLVQHYFITGSLSQFDKLTVTPQIFAMLRKEFKKQYENLPELVKKQIQDVEEQVSKKLSNEEVSVKYQNDAIIPVGVEYEDETILATSMIITSSFVINGEKSMAVQAAVTTMILIKNKVFLLYGYTPYKSKADLVSCKNATLKVAKTILQANQSATYGKSVANKY